MPAEYRDDLWEMCQQQFASDPGIEPGKMMGHPGMKTAHNNKFFLFAYEDGLALKMPPEKYEEVIARSDVTPFQPGNDTKPMSTWIVWSAPDAEDFVNEWAIINWALNYTASKAPNPRKKRKK